MITPYQPTRNVGLTCRGGFNIAGINHRVKLVRSTAADCELLSALFFRGGGLNHACESVRWGGPYSPKINYLNY
jgi:hypothetical protein